MTKDTYLPNTKGNNEQRKCGSKKRNLTKKAAEKQKAVILKEDPTAEIGVYLCPFCHYWHVGRKRYADDEKPEIKPKPKKTKYRPKHRKTVLVINGKQVRG